MKRLLFRAVPLLLLLLGVACGDQPVDPLGTTAPISRVVLQPTVDTIFLRDTPLPTDQVALQASVIGFSGTVLPDARVRWSTANPEVVSVDSLGVVRPVGAGTATVLAKAGGKEGRATVVVAVIAATVRVTTAITEASVGDTLRLAAAVVDENGVPVTSGATFTWTSSNPAVATVDAATGLARFIAPGTVRFTATSATAGSASTANITVIERKYVAVASGYDHSCSVLSTGEAYCWGRGSEGQIGTAKLDTLCYDQEDPELRKKACTLAPKRAETAVRFSRIAAGGLFTCGVSTTQRAYCWGLDTLGQLGGGKLTSTAAPTLVTSIVNFRDVTAGAGHACGLTTVNTAFCWGYDVYGQLGNAGLRFTSSTPIAVDGELRFQQISAGGLHTCGVLVGGRVVCWGANQFGQVGSTQPATDTVGGILVFDAPRTVTLPGNLGAVQVTASQGIGDELSAHSCALAANGGGLLLGLQSVRRARDGKPFGRAEWAGRGGGRSDVHADRRRNGSTCGISGGNVYCWGRNSFGQTGNDLTPPLLLPTEIVTTPTQVAQPVAVDPTTGLSTPVNAVFTSITAGRRHACATAQDGTLFCWGSDVMGALGSQQQQIVQTRPVRVSRPL
jgi:alpha-tubulin suppressor-like RCC1 family protein